MFTMQHPGGACTSTHVAMSKLAVPAIPTCWAISTHILLNRSYMALSCRKYAKACNKVSHMPNTATTVCRPNAMAAVSEIGTTQSTKILILSKPLILNMNLS